MTSPSLSILILAAGKGTRMKSDKAKVLHEVFFAPMVHHVIKAALPLNPRQTIAIIGHQQSAVENTLQSFNVETAVQEQQLGTGHAVLTAETTVISDADAIMILCGDIPLIRTETLQAMYSFHCQRSAKLTLMTTILDNPTNYGRILCNTDGNVQGIVEQKDATKEQLDIREINAGIYCVDKTFLFSSLKNVGTNNSQGEVYLTDIVGLAVKKGYVVEKYTTDSPIDVLGVNSRIELADAEHELQLRRNRELMLQGVTMRSPDSISVSPNSSIGQDSVIEFGVHISDGCEIGQSCTVEQGTILKNCRIGENVTIGPYSCLEDTTIAPNTALAPYSEK